MKLSPLIFFFQTTICLVCSTGSVLGQDWLIKNSKDTLRGAVEEWNADGLRIILPDKEKPSKFKTSEILECNLTTNEFHLQRRFIENRGKNLLLPDRLKSDTTISLSKSDTLRIISNDSLVLYILSKDEDRYVGGSTGGPNSISRPGTWVHYTFVRVYAWSPSLGMNLIHEPDPAEIDRMDSFNQLMAYFGTNATIRKNLEDDKESYRFLPLEYKLRVFSEYSGRKVTYR